MCERNWNGDEEEDSSNELLKEPKSSYSLAISRPKHLEEIVFLNQNYEGEKKKSETELIRRKKEKPNGGWGWMVVLGVAISNMTTQSLISVFGLLFIQRLSELEITTRGASIMVGVQTTSLNLSGLVIGPVIKRFSYRKTALVGALIFVGGLLLTLFADSLTKLVFSYSLLTGVGLGLLSPSTFVAINSYFSTRRGRAVGLAVAGTGIGQMLLPLLIELLLEEYDFNGTILILAGIALHSILGATLYQPIKWHLKNRLIAEDLEDSEMMNSETPGSKVADSNLNLNSDEKEEKWLSKLIRILNFELLNNLSFVNLVTGLALVYVGNMCFSMLLPFFLESIDYSRPRIALCMSVLSGADIVGRLIVPVFTDGFKMRCKTVFFLGAALSALTRSAFVWHRDYKTTLILSAVCGIVRAALVCNFNLSISEQIDPEKLPSALGLHMLFKGVAIMTFAPLIGFVRDYTKSYTLCIHILSVFFLAFPFFTWLVEFLCTKRKFKEFCLRPCWKK